MLRCIEGVTNKADGSRLTLDMQKLLKALTTRSWYDTVGPVISYCVEAARIEKRAGTDSLETTQKVYAQVYLCSSWLWGAVA
jgi:hypothetical protein